MEIYLYKAAPGSFEEPPIEEEKRADYIGQEFFCSLDEIDGLEAVEQGSDDWLKAARLARRVWGGEDPLRSHMLALLDTEQLVTDIRAEVARRILSHASTGTQMNMAAAAAAGILDDDQMAAFRSGLLWVAAVRQTGQKLATELDPDFRDDEKWPEAPAEADALAKMF